MVSCKLLPVNGGKNFGTDLEGRKGFASKMGEGFEQDFRKGSSLHIYLDETKIDQLSLSGTAVAMDAVNRCLVGVRAAIAAEKCEKARWAHLPKDPLAKSSPTPLADQTQPLRMEVPTPRGNPSYWVTFNDYPTAALRENRSGTTSFQADVGADGRVSKCNITQSSGHADLDNAGCNAVSRRARFNPALDDKGNPIAGSYSQKINWSANVVAVEADEGDEE